MKKQCTNSRCRRMFNTASLVEKCCPHCGAEYPRLGNSFVGSGNCHIQLMTYIPNVDRATIEFVRIIRRIRSKGLRDAVDFTRDIIQRLPAELAGPMPVAEAKIWKQELEALGCTVRIVR